MKYAKIWTTVPCGANGHQAADEARIRIRIAAHRSVAVLLVLIAIVFTAHGQQYQTNWEPNRYKVKCASSGSNCLTSLYPAIETNLVDIVAKYKADAWRARSILDRLKGPWPPATR